VDTSRLSRQALERPAPPQKAAGTERGERAPAELAAGRELRAPLPGRVCRGVASAHAARRALARRAHHAALTPAVQNQAAEVPARPPRAGRGRVGDAGACWWTGQHHPVHRMCPTFGSSCTQDSTAALFPSGPSYTRQVFQARGAGRQGARAGGQLLQPRWAGRRACGAGGVPPPSYQVDTSRPSPRTNRTRRVPHPVLIGHAASLTPSHQSRDARQVQQARAAADADEAGAGR